MLLRDGPVVGGRADGPRLAPLGRVEARHAARAARARRGGGRAPRRDPRRGGGGGSRRRSRRCSSGWRRCRRSARSSSPPGRPTTSGSGTSAAGSSPRWARPAASAPRWSSRTWPSPWRTWPHGTVELQRAHARHGYDEGIIFGHALDGNLHFVFTQDFGAEGEVARYPRFMDDVCAMVVQQVRRVAQGRARHRAQRGAVRGAGVGREGLPAHAAGEGAARSAGPPQPRRDPERRPARPPRAPQGAAAGPPADRPLHRVRLLRAALPVARPHRHAAPADRGPARDGPAPAPAARTPPRLARLEADYVYRGEETCATDGLCATRLPGGHRHRRAHEVAARPGPRRGRRGGRPRGGSLRRRGGGRPGRAADRRRGARGARGPGPGRPLPRPAPALRRPAAGLERGAAPGRPTRRGWTGRGAARPSGWSTSRPAWRAPWARPPATPRGSTSTGPCSRCSARPATTWSSRPAWTGSAAACPSSRRASRSWPTARAASSRRRCSRPARAAAGPIVCDTSPCLQRMRKATRPAAHPPRAGRVHPRPPARQARLHAASPGRWRSTSPAAPRSSGWPRASGRWPRPAPSRWWCRGRSAAAASPATAASRHPELNARALGPLRAGAPGRLPRGLLQQPDLRDRPLAPRRHPLPPHRLPRRPLHRAARLPLTALPRSAPHKEGPDARHHLDPELHPGRKPARSRR